MPENYIGLTSNTIKLAERFVSAVESIAESLGPQKQPASPVPSNPAVHGTPDILAQLRDRVIANITDATMLADGYRANGNNQRYREWKAEVVAFNRVLRWLDELTDANQQDSTRHEVE